MPPAGTWGRRLTMVLAGTHPGRSVRPAQTSSFHKQGSQGLRADMTCPGSHTWRGLSSDLNTDPPRFFHDTRLNLLKESRNSNHSKALDPTPFPRFRQRGRKREFGWLGLARWGAHRGGCFGPDTPLGTHIRWSHTEPLALLSRGGAAGRSCRVSSRAE